MILESFHFLRPAWLLALVPLAVVLWAASRSAAQGSAWRRVVDAHLLRHLVLTENESARRWPLVAGAIAGVAACVALAGPTWERLPQPTFASTAPTVVVLDMSPSMRADDLAPSRLGRARLELHDLLARNKGGQIGLVLYTDEPFVAAPLTDDARLIEALIPTLESGLMPLRPGRADRALVQAKALLDQAGAASGRVLLITDGLDGHVAETLAAARDIAASGRTLSVLGAATDEGTTERDLRGRVVTGADGEPVVTKLDREGLEALAQAGGGAFSEIRADDTDLARVAPALPAGDAREATSGSSAQFDVWRDAGIWLVLIPLALAPLAFRRGLVAALALAVLASAPSQAEASVWSDLWSRPDQQAQAALDAGDAAAAAELFEHPEWKAAAAYESGDYEQAIAAYEQLEGEDNAYNRGNALARAGKLEDAIAAYDQVLASLPQHEDAKFNRDLVQRLLDQQKQQQQQNGQSDASQDASGGGDAQQQDQQAGAGQQGEPQSDGAQQGDASQSGAQNDQQQASNGGSSSSAQPDAGPDGAAQDAQANADDEQQPNGGEQQQEQTASANAGAQPQDDAHDANAAHAAGASQDDAARADAEQQQQQQQQLAANGRAPQPDADADDAHANAAEQKDDAAARADRELAQRLDQELADQGDDQARDDANGAVADAQDANGDARAENDARTGSASGSARRPVDEREQAREQALRSIPDDPAGLLRAKIRRQYAERRYAQQEVNP